MNAESKIIELKKQIESLQREQKNCNHKWGAPKFDPETIKVQDDRAGYEVHGSDRWPILSFHDEKKDRWKRECETCGTVQYTYKNEPMVTKYEPKF